MVTRTRNNIFKSNPRYGLASSLQFDIEPRTVSKALFNSHWREAMSAEFSALQKNGSWDVGPPSLSQNVVGCKWVFRIKRKPDGSIDKFKARFVAKGLHQRLGVNFSETFSPVVKPAIVCIILSLAVSHNWPLRRFDVNNAFLNRTLPDEVYTSQPPGFSDKDFTSYVCRL